MIKNILAKAYGAVTRRFNKSFDNKSKSLVYCDVPVISVGNLSTGGTGKTPLVHTICLILKENNISPGIIGRGYKRSSKGEIIVSDGNSVLADAQTAGDEMLMLAETLRVPVIAHEDKSAAAISMQAKFDVDVIVLDDGFQHRKLHRDIDILILDRETIEKPWLLPKGRLREDISGIHRADVIVLSGDFELSLEFIKLLRPDTILARTLPKQGIPYNIFDFNDKLEMHSRMMLFAGIAKSYRFFDMVSSSSYEIVKQIEFDDHHKYTKGDIARLIAECKKNNLNRLATTAKDAVKLAPYKELLQQSGIKCYAFPLFLQITDGALDFKKILRNTKK